MHAREPICACAHGVGERITMPDPAGKNGVGRCGIIGCHRSARWIIGGIRADELLCGTHRWALDPIVRTIQLKAVRIPGVGVTGARIRASHIELAKRELQALRILQGQLDRMAEPRAIAGRFANRKLGRTAALSGIPGDPRPKRRRTEGA